MASLYEYLGQKHNHSDKWTFSGRNTVCITEIHACGSDNEDKHVCRSHELNQQDLKCRLEAQNETGSLQIAPVKPVLQVIWISRLVQAREFDISEDLFVHLHELLGHSLARYASCTALAGISTVSSQPTDSATGFVSFLPKFSMTWATSAQNTGQTILCLVEESKKQILEDLLRQAFVQRLSRSPAISALITSILFSIEIDEVQEKVKQDVRQVEVRTGHHDWKTRGEAPALGDMIGLAAKMSGCSTRIESCLRKQHARDDFVRQISQQCDLSQRGSLSAARIKQNEEILNIVGALNDWSRAQLIDTAFIKARVRTQLDALYQLVAQNDALSAQITAQDGRLLAAASLRDSTSMRCIAIVTMFFLPGTFVSSLMSIPLFDWDTDLRNEMYRSSHWRPVAIVFAAMTLPLMALTFGTWGLWMLFDGTKRQQKKALAKAQLGQQLTDDEVRLLTSKRRTLSEHLRQFKEI